MWSRDRFPQGWRRTFLPFFLFAVGLLTPLADPAAAAVITISDGQTFAGSPVTIESLYTTDLGATGRQYRLLGRQSDGFNGTTLNSKWTKSDIGGDVTPAPTVNGTLSLTGSGTDIGSATTANDGFTYLYQSGISGDFTIDVHIASMTGTRIWAKAGLMVRQNLTANSKQVSMLMTKSKGAQFNWRATAGALATTSTSANTIVSPRWLRLVRTGNSFSGYYSTDGRTWTQQGTTQTITMTNPVVVGLAVTSRSTTEDNTAVFDNFLFMPAGPPAPSGMVNTWNNTSGAAPASVTISNWTDGYYGLSVRDSGTALTPETNTFYWNSCTDGTPSTITIPAGQTVKGSAINLHNLHSSTGNVGSFTFKINGSTVLSPWSSFTLVPAGTSQVVTLDVTGTDPDCGGRTITASRTVTVDNTCIDGTPSTLTVRTGQTVGGSAVDLSSLLVKTGNVAGLTYYVNGALVSTPWNSTSFGTSTPETVTLEVRGTDPDCSGTSLDTYNQMDVDNTCVRTPPTIHLDEETKYVGPGRALQFQVTVSNEDSPNCSSSTFTIALAGETNSTDFNASSLVGSTNFALAGRASATLQMTVSAKSSAPEWNQNLTTLRVTSSLGAPHGTVDKVAKTVAFLVSPITHNSVTTGSTKWGGKWGTSETGSKYGNFTCTTCHEKGTGNIKWLSTSVATPDGTNWGNSGATTLPFTFNDGRNGDWWGNDDPNNDLAGRTSSNRACEVCHSTTLYHRYNTNVDPDGAGPLTAQTEKRHFNTRNCIDCHRHSQGFTAGCDFCHGNPPLSATPGLNGLAYVPNTTGSATHGTHYKHVKVLGYQCTNCHSTYRNAGVMPNTGPNAMANIDLYFKAFGSSDPKATTGSYGGQDGVSYNGIVVAPGDGDMTCTNVYCHGETIGGSDPLWYGNVTCNACHGTSVMSPPPGRSHQTHVVTLGIACSDCHGSTPGNTGHVNGKVKWDVSALARKNPATPVTYRSAETGETNTFAPSATYGSCSNVKCHYGTTTPPWNNNETPATCTTCHNDGSDTGLLSDAGPNTGKHIQHMDGSHVMAAAWVNKCESCHGPGANTATHGTHLNWAIEFAPGMTYAAPNCDTFCHGPSTLNNWTAASSGLACQACHAAPYLGPTVVNTAGTGLVVNAGTAQERTIAGYGSHMKALKTDTIDGATNWDTQCKKCHPYHTGGVLVPNPPSNWTQPGISDGVSMAERLGLNYTVTGGVHLGGTGTSGTTEAEICWNCHDAGANTVSEWGTNSEAVTPIVITSITKSATAPTITTATTHGLAVGNIIQLNIASPSEWLGHNGWAGRVASVPTTTTFTIATDTNSYTSAFSSASGSAEMVRLTDRIVISAITRHATAPTVTTAVAHNLSIGQKVQFFVSAPSNWKPHDKVTGTVQTTPTTTTFTINTNTSGYAADFSSATGSAQISRAYDYGSLSASTWTSATWTSGTASFGYKTAAISSTHSASPNGVVGNDTVANLRCTYCHDVHDMNRAMSDPTNGVLEAQTGKPFLRGTWIGNFYKEDGAPQSGTQYTSANNYGQVPRGSNSQTQKMGGYWIDQNSGSPTSGKTYADFGGICQLCHGTNINTLNQFGSGTGGSMTDWVSTYNGHANSVLGGAGPGSGAELTARNIYGGRGGSTTGYAGYAHYAGRSSFPGENSAGLRGRDNSFNKGPKIVGWGSESTLETNVTYNTDNWGVNETGATTESGYHQFSCAKCHNPHASRLPRLMITNCLDTKQNKWDNGSTVDANWSSTNLTQAQMQIGDNSADTTEIDQGSTSRTIPAVLRGTTLSNWTTAQNCHRRAGDDPNHPDDAAGQGSGWNTVTPW